MHAANSLQVRAPFSPLARSRRFTQSGFSLVEVTMAIGIIAFAFVALLGLLPAGLSSFRSAIDTNNETRILQSLIGKVQLTDFNEIPQMDYATSNEVFYYDEEGSLTDTSLKQSEPLVPLRIYAAKLFIEEAASRDSEDLTKQLNFSTNVMVVFTNLQSPAVKDFNDLNTLEDVKTLLTKKKSKTDIRIRPVLVSKMDAVTKN